MQSTLRLFKAVPVESKLEKRGIPDHIQKTARLGFVFAPEVLTEYPDIDPLIKTVEEAFAVSPEALNSSFHKSWEKVATADIEQLVIEQIVHYITTYGFQAAGIYSEDTVYIPNENLEIPDLDEKGISLTVIRGLTKKELKEKLMVMLESGIALAEDTKKDVLDVATFVGMSVKDVALVKNKEVSIALYDYLGLVPKNPVEFLRYAVYRSSNQTLLIKNSALISAIKENDNLRAVKLFSDYEKQHGLEPLAQIFNRFKPIFLAFRGNKRLNIIINKIRRLSTQHHKPMEEDYLNSVTHYLSSGVTVSAAKLKSELENVNTFRKVRLAYALKFRTKKMESIMYRVRNGRGYATEFNFTKHTAAKRALAIVLVSIAEDVRKNVDHKKIFIPDFIKYALPATEKQYTGMFPSGTYVTVPGDLLLGINWKNTNGKVDLDLALTGIDGKLGWDGAYRSDGGGILFSGDIVDAKGKNGATELFYVKTQPEEEKDMLLTVNYYDFRADNKVPFKIIVASENREDLPSNYTVDPNNLITVAASKFDGRRQLVLGVLVTTPDENRFYFAQTAVGNSITSGHRDHDVHARQYLADFYKDSIGLAEILELAGAELVDDAEEADINLSPETLEKDSILALLT